MAGLKRVLIANRGEIAVRIIRACKELGIETIQVYSTADSNSLAVKLADYAICIGPGHSAKSYLDIPSILAAAQIGHADAIHPGYGFLAENAEFAELCSRNGITFIGPDSGVIRLMGDKAAARDFARSVGVPTVPGSEGSVENVEEALAISQEIGFPILIKAVAGGGGRGMRVAETPQDLSRVFESAKREAVGAFGDGRLYMERYLPSIRHIEVQVLGDGKRVIHVGERDCTIQRRHRKLLEEAPAPTLRPELREEILRQAVQLTTAVGYHSAGTVEFIFDEVEGKSYFIEMNTRIQVEHPVTEMISGIDLVKEQILLERDGRLRLRQEDVQISGHALECRINAEDPNQQFRPAPGIVKHFHVPGGPGVRVDTHLFSGYEVPPYYDSLLAKVVTWGATREEALSRMRRALLELDIEGVTTTSIFHQKLLEDSCFLTGVYDTQFVDRVYL